jgi:DNA helicase-2/ATP-dependent DNA helicase PcrA
MEDILKGLNPQQKEAVAHDNGALLVLAGAGSGKTKVLTSRIAALIKKGVRPYEILAVTFTNKAAKEMKARLTKSLGEEIVKDLWVGTFHNICGRILRYDIENYKNEEGQAWQKNFVIFDSNDSLSLIKQAIKAENLDEKVYQPKMVQSAISMAKNKMQNAFQYATKARDYRAEIISKLYFSYEQSLASNNALDFDDLLLMSVNVLTKCPEVLAKYHNRFKHILVDEYQDTNLTQYRLISTLFTAGNENLDLKNRSLCVVGDVDQSIYSWRGADYKIIMNFQRDYSSADIIKLEQNYRSTDTILQAANYVIQNNTQRIDKKLVSNKGKGKNICHFEAHDEQEEAYYLVNKIRELLASGFSYKNCVVLYRTNAQSRVIEEAFMSRSIPYTMVGGMKFYERKEIKDIVSYLKLIYNPNDSQSLKRIINVPTRAIGATTVKKLDEKARQKNVCVFSVVENIEEEKDFSPKTTNALKNFAKLILSFREKLETMSLSEFIALLIDSSGYINELREEGTDEAESRIENLQEFISVARNFEQADVGNDLGEFLSQVALVSDIDQLEEEKESVTLMTLHAAKGLEFPVVFLAGLEEGLFPHSRALNENNEMEEERRLMYVGITRAEDLLYITNAKRRLIYGDYKYFTKSRFLEEIPQHLFEGDGARKSTESNSYGNQSAFVNNAGRTEPRNAFNGLKPLSSSYEGDRVSSSGGFGKGFVPPKKSAFSSISKPSGEVKPPQNNKINEFKPTVAYKLKSSNEVKPVLNKAPDIKPYEPTKLTQKLKEKKEEPVVKKKAASLEDVKDHLSENLQLKLSIQQKAEQYVTKVEKEEPAELFNKGERVFHEKYGIGTIEEILEFGSDISYHVDFGKQGLKPLDAKFAKLKKF